MNSILVFFSMLATFGSGQMTGSTLEMNIYIKGMRSKIEFDLESLDLVVQYKNISSQPMALVAIDGAELFCEPEPGSTWFGTCVTVMDSNGVAFHPRPVMGQESIAESFTHLNKQEMDSLRVIVEERRANSEEREATRIGRHFQNLAHEAIILAPDSSAYTYIDIRRSQFLARKLKIQAHFGVSESLIQEIKKSTPTNLENYYTGSIHSNIVELTITNYEDAMGKLNRGE